MLVQTTCKSKACATRGPLSYSICDLPDDILLRVFEHLAPQETVELISCLKEMQSKRKDQTQLMRLSNFAHRRLYKGRTIVVCDNASGRYYSQYDCVFSFEAFQDKFAQMGDEEPKSNLENHSHVSGPKSSPENSNSNPFQQNLNLHASNFNSHASRQVFMETRPQSLDFRLVRGSNDYTKFLSDLRRLNQVLDGLSSPGIVSEYFQHVYQLGFYLDGNTITLESPTSLLTATLKIVIALANNKTVLKDALSNKFRTLTIKSTDIGNYYVSQWGQLLGRFGSVTVLDLSDNILRSDTNSRTEGESEAKLDFMAHCFVWPPRLKKLVLDRNLITYISRDFAANLPRSLEHLSLAHNQLSSFAVNGEDQFNIASSLPNLQFLNLGNNYSVSLINTDAFTGLKELRHNFTLSIQGCNVETINMQQLQSKATQQGFTLVV